MNVQSIDPPEPRTAAQWFAARRSAHNEDLERRFSAWLAASTANFEAYALCELTWELSASAAAGMTASPAALPWYRRPLVRAAAAAAALVAFGVLTFIQLTRPGVSKWQTQPGQQLSVSLQDGSHITLNTRSSVEVRMSHSRRVVRVLEGEVFFDVARDRLRPFAVQTALGSVRAVGTRFDVLLDSQHLEVNMEEGKVLIRSAAAGGQESMATAGMRATLLPGSPRPEVAAADLNRIENWRAHRVEFDRVPLGEALQELSRYTPVPIRAGSPEVARIMISAVLKTGDVDALRATLKGAFGLRVVEGGRQYVVVERAD
ncbi:MAG: FecR domain-containing protein [Proteobacteria bacterium]|nr:FecR domain-containing protein [Pseudomonadota bacterium]